MKRVLKCSAMSRKRLLRIALTVPPLLTAVVGVVLLWPKPSVPVSVVRPQMGLVEEIVSGTTVGSVEAQRSASICAETSGRVIQISVREGPVKKDQEVIRVDSSEIQSERVKIQAEISVSRDERLRAVLAKERAQDLLKRQETLDPSIRIDQEYERIKKDFAIATKDVEIAEGRIRTLEAALGLLETRLRKTEVRSPFDGIVTKLHVEEGDTVVPGRLAFSVVSTGPLRVRVQIDEVDMGKLRLGCPARVRFDAYDQRQFAGSVVEILPAAATDAKYNRTVDVKVEVPEMPPNIVVGMSAHVEIITRTQDGVLRLPNQVVREDHRNRMEFVYVVMEGRARRRAIRSGLSNWEYREILEGLTPEDRVIVPVIAEEAGTVEDGTRVSADER